MVKNVVIGLLTVAVIFFGTYAYVKANEAERQTIIAHEYAVDADEAAAEARKQESLAILEAERADRAREEAEVQRLLALEALAECRGK